MSGADDTPAENAKGRGPCWPSPLLAKQNNAFLGQQKTRRRPEPATGWLGWRDSNPRMRESKSRALPLGDNPRKRKSGNRAVGQPGSAFSVGWLVGLEPTASRATIWRASQLRHSHHIMVRPKGLEPLAHCLEGSCSIHLSYGRTPKVIPDWDTLRHI